MKKDGDNLDWLVDCEASNQAYLGQNLASVYLEHHNISQESDNARRQAATCAPSKLQN